MEREVFKECTRNHAANLGTFQSDGYNQFCPSKILEDHCACCGCHRYYHRKITIIDLEGPTVGNGGGYGCSCSLREAKRLARLRGSATSETSSISDASVRRKKTKFTSAQKTAMRAFAERLGWTMKNLRETKRQEEVKRFCDGIGVSRFVFKTWVNNNKKAYGYGSTPGAKDSSSSFNKNI